MSFTRAFISIISTWILLFVIYVNGQEKIELHRTRAELRAHQEKLGKNSRCLDPTYKLETQVGRDCSRLESQAELR